MPDCSFNDCLIAPIPDKCFKYCIYQILLLANPEEKREVLRFSENTAEKIFEAFNVHRIRDFEGLTRFLTNMQLDETISIFRNIGQKQLDYFAQKK